MIALVLPTLLGSGSCSLTWTRETVAKDLRSEQAVPHLGSYVVRTPEHREWLTPDVKQGLSLAELRRLGFGK